MTKILLIDDEEITIQALKVVLDKAGYTVATAPDGVQGMNLIKEGGFDVVVTDIIMPEKEGLETLSEIKKDFTDVKVIVMSGGGRMNSGTYLKFAETLGADGILSKPFTASELLVKIDEVLS